MLKIFNKSKNYIWILLFLSIMTRLPFLQNSLWHNDAADFVNSGVHWADTGKYLPAHSPDYPGWVLTISLFEKIYEFLSGSYSLITLPNLLAAIFGIGSVLMLYLLVKKLTARPVIALISALFLIFMPAFWAINQVALADSPAIFWILLSLYFFFDYFETQKPKKLIYFSLSLLFAVLIRLNIILFLPILLLLLIVLIVKSNEKINKEKWWLGLVSIFMPLLALLVYYLIHDADWSFITETSRRVTPSLNDLSNTALKLWVTSIPPILFLWSLSLWQILKEKKWLILGLIFIPVVIFYYYYAGWWQAGSFDIDRYLVITAPFVSMGAALALYKLWSKQSAKIIISLIFGVYCLLIILSFFSVNFCMTTQRSVTDRYFFSRFYCSIDYYAIATEERLDIFQFIQKYTSTDAVIFVSSYEWSYPELFGNKYSTEQRIFINFINDDENDLQAIEQRVSEGEIVYLIVRHTSQGLWQKVNSQSWDLEILKDGQNAILLKINQ